MFGACLRMVREWNEWLGVVCRATYELKTSAKYAFSFAISGSVLVNSV